MENLAQVIIEQPPAGVAANAGVAIDVAEASGTKGQAITGLAAAMEASGTTGQAITGLAAAMEASGTTGQAIADLAAAMEAVKVAGDKSPLRGKNTTSRQALKLQIDEDELISQLFLTSAPVDKSTKAYGDQRYMDGFLEAQALERDENLRAIEQVRQQCLKTHELIMSRPVLSRTGSDISNLGSKEPTRFVRQALARVPVVDASL